MAISISSCLKPSSLPPPPPPPPLSPVPSPLDKTTLVPWTASSKQASWRSRCVATAACIVIGSSTAVSAGSDGAVLAGDLKVMEVSEGKVVRWSDTIRKCPPWRVNSLENIVPENLPRPWTGRRSNGLVDYRSAPAVGGTSIQFKSSCHSL